MYQFRTFRIGSATGKGGWYWQVTKDVGPIELLVARCGNPFLTEDDAIAGYKDFVKWASQPSSTTPPTDQAA